jgi:hypothetical protein
MAVLPPKRAKVRVRGVTGTGHLVDETGTLLGGDFRCRMIDVRVDGRRHS